MGCTEGYDDVYASDERSGETGARSSDVYALCGARALVKMAHHLHHEGALDAAHDTAMDALVAWANAPGEVDEEIMVEMLDEACGVQSRAILDVVASAGALSALRRRQG